MRLSELINEIYIRVYVTNEEKKLLKKLRTGTKKDKLSERERDVLLKNLRIKGLVE
jgi:hypothetical protein